MGIPNTRSDKKISIHAPAKGATLRLRSGCTCWKFQSTLPRRERRKKYMQRVIHLIFQSTLPRRERRLAAMVLVSQHYYFNPRSREGSDITGINQNPDTGISIHAPAKGATRQAVNGATDYSLFQSTLPRRERQQYFTNPQVNIVKH